MWPHPLDFSAIFLLVMVNNVKIYEEKYKYCSQTWMLIIYSKIKHNFSGLAAILLFLESRKLYELRSEAKNLVGQMQHSQPEHALHQLRDQLHQQQQLGYFRN